MNNKLSQRREHSPVNSWILNSAHHFVGTFNISTGAKIVCAEIDCLSLNNAADIKAIRSVAKNLLDLCDKENRSTT